MYKIDFSKPIHIHFIGIGGISMSGLAEISCMRRALQFPGLRFKGIRPHKNSCCQGHKSHIWPERRTLHPVSTWWFTLQLSTKAILSLPQQRQPVFQCLQEPSFSSRLLLDNYDYSIAVAGTHGKTTTTSMMSEILSPPPRQIPYHFRRWYFVIYPRQSACGRFRILHL